MKSKWLTSISVTALALGASAGTTLAAGMDDLVAAAKKEGQLTTIALPHDWCGYGALIDGFKAKYGLDVNELNPDAGSGDEIEAIKANKGNTGPQAPDVIDVGLSFGPSAKADGLLQPYKVATWDTIPDSAKDADGAWYGDYYGVLAVRGEQRHRQEVAAGLGRPARRRLQERAWRSPAIRAPPTRRSRASMPPASPARAATPAKAGEAGLKFFADLNKNGNFVPVIGKAASLAQGSTPIIIRWDYNALADRDTLKGNPPVEVVVPKTGVVAGVYVQAISAFAPHPNAAKLWMEYLYSDEGQLGWLEGLLPPDPLQRPRQERQDPGGPARQAAAGGQPTPRRCSRPSTSRRRPRTRSPSSGTRSSAPTCK